MIDAHITSLLGIGGVNIFLLLSGYGLFQSFQKNGLQGKVFWDKKIEKVFLPYTIITVIYYLYMMLRGIAPGFPALLLNVLCIDYSRRMDGTMWYMSFLLLWYLAFFLVFYFKGPMVGKVGMLLLLGCAFRSYWLKDTFAGCAWQFYTNAYAFPCGVGLAYLEQLMNRSLFSEKCREYLFTGVRIAVFLMSLIILVLGVWQMISMDYWKCGIALFFVLYGLLSLLKKEVKLLKWLGANSFMIYLIEGKLIAVWNQFTFLRENIAIYLLSYAAATVGIVYLYRFVCSIYSRFRSFLELEPTHYENQKRIDV